MKKQSTLTLIASVFIMVIYGLSCRKHLSSSGPATGISDSSQALILEARQYFDQQKYSDSIAEPGDTLPMDRTSLHKTPLWDLAQVQTLSIGNAIVVPLNIAENLSVEPTPGAPAIPVRQITWLLLYRSQAAGWHAEVVTHIPSAGTLQGKVRVEDWQGHFLKGYLYAGGKATRLNSATTFKRTPAAHLPQGALAAVGVPQCNATDWYACSSIGGESEGCEYEYTTEECAGGISSDDGSGSPNADDYAAIGGGGSAGAGAAAVSTITPDSTITGNPIVACVYNNLMSPKLTIGLKNVLSAFSASQVYNVTFTVADISSSKEGTCQYLGGNNFLITLNALEANDPDYSRIWLASTIIHEAFHAKLRQKALATFGEATIAQWPTPIDDMDLAELATYFEADSKSDNIWQSVEHDWMVSNITEMADCLEDFVQTFYPTLYAQVGSNPTPYIALMYMGLEGSTLYQESVVNTGLSATYQQYWGDLNEGGKCPD
jgi:hypothetical protein